MNPLVYPCGHSSPDSCERCDPVLTAQRSRRNFLRGLAGATALLAAPRPFIQVPRAYGTIRINGLQWTFHKTDEEPVFIAEISTAWMIAT